MQTGRSDVGRSHERAHQRSPAAPVCGAFIGFLYESIISANNLMEWRGLGRLRNQLFSTAPWRQPTSPLTALADLKLASASATPRLDRSGVAIEILAGDGRKARRPVQTTTPKAPGL